MIRRFVAPVLGLAVGFATPVASAAAQRDGAAFGHRIPAPIATAARRIGPIRLDGRLDDSAWAAARPITDFRQIDPDEGQPASQRTEVRFLFDNEALYVGARMFDSEGAGGVTTRLVRRDASFDSDYFEMVIDGFHDHLSRAFFDVNPSGSKQDFIGIGTSCCDPSWDPVWEAATQVDSAGWTAEIRIPFSQLRFSRDSAQVWGLQVRRFLKRRDEQDQWSFWGKTESGGPSRFGHLVGLRMGASQSSLELLPYAVSKSSSLAGTPGDPFDTRGRPTMRAGLDLKNRLTTNLTLDATFNPDFGQVEVDPAVLNLSAFETFFPEKRPFFVEGAQVFDFGNFSCSFCSNVEGMSAFYSRRVGRAPTGASLAQDNFQFADVPDATPILGAAKITGRTTNGFTIGLLDAVTGRSSARVATSSGVRAMQEVEPLGDYFVGRLKRDALGGNLVVGAIAAGVARSIDSTFAPRLATHAELYGGDVLYTFGDRTYSVRGSAALTNVSGDARAILLRQQSSARYFQRPDRGAGSGGFLSNRYNPAATSLRGAGGYARVGKDAGDWFGEVAVNTRTPGYESNDFAFQQRADYIWYSGNIGHFWSKPTSWYQSLSALAGAQLQRSFEGNNTGTELHQYVSATTRAFWNATAFHLARPAVIDEGQLRGGPAIKTFGSHYVEADVSTDSRHRWVGSVSLNHYWNSRDGLSTGGSVNATYRPRPNFSVSFGPSYNGSRGGLQYVSAVADSTAGAFYGNRYVMSDLQQRTLGLDTRASVTFTPTMTLEVYVQPFFAAARYTSFEEYSAPRSDRLAVYGRDLGTITAIRDTTGQITKYTIDPDGVGRAPAFSIANPDFTQQSLRGNAVFRWEYRPGSVLYVAWTQSRAGEQAFGTLDFARDRTALLASRPENVFLVKASWWMTR
jgi:hypothetical protein